ncbi:Putative DNA recombination protein RmuC [Candidatus Providencia siddallii]|uniref:Putative DNA recombination protein RmuC n=1 Tax=Candidatus Providencia siddallii TaxID=1715285 RepID=A0A0M6W7V3_9GAMM|nr:Putative DNA recombination protein RmuC [Candidatus Providencia siddallii]
MMDYFLYIILILYYNFNNLFCFIFFYLKKNKLKKINELQNLNHKLDINNKKIFYLMQWKDKYDELNQEIKTLRIINHEQEIKIKEANIKFEQIEIKKKEQQIALQNNEKYLSIKIENLSNHIFEKYERRASECQQKKILSILLPFREQLDGLKEQVQRSFIEEAKERHTLTFEIKQLQQLNEQINKETLNLTRALKGDYKLQGNWGETILTRILEISGLRDGIEFETQVSIKTTKGRYQLDVIIHLPENKDIIIDAKTSLVYYERYFNSEKIDEQKQELKNHVSSIKNNIRMLSKKEYYKLPGIRTLNYILMFISIEPAYLLALKEAPELLDEGLKNNVVLVCPSSLLAVIRIINNTWRYERQKKNSKEIANNASKIYDKLRLFIDDMEILGSAFDKANTAYKSAMKRLMHGRGNLISQAENLTKLGVEIKHPIESKIIDNSD